MGHQTFYSNGKLLLTSEYLVLDGATALALPTKFGQFLTVEECAGTQIHWKSYDHDGKIWFEDTINIEALSEVPEHGVTIRSRLIGILAEAQKLNPKAFRIGCTITTRLTFPKAWGLGTSSTLVNNLAQWLDIDAYTLLSNTFGGSGYDIACAQHDTPILFCLEQGIPIVESVNFRPAFSAHLFFIYLNHKQDSREAIASYRQKRFNVQESVDAANALTYGIINAVNLDEFATALQKHEALIGEILQMRPVQPLLFPDFPGTLKSLGAWGGDFMLAVSETDPSAYFNSKGYNTVIPFNNMVK